MKKLFTLMMLLLCAVVNMQAEDISVTWSMADGESSVGVASPGTAATNIKWSYGSNIVYHSVNTFWAETDPESGIAIEGTGKTLTLFSNTTKLDNKREKLDNNWIEFAFTPAGGMFTPSSVTFDITKVGTGDPKIWVYFIDGEGNTITLGEAVAIRRNSEATPSETQTFSVGGATPSDKAVALRVYIGKLANNKQVAIGNVEIKGTLMSSDSPVMTVGPTELTMKANPFKTSVEGTVTLSGKNLTDGTYDVTVPSIDGLSIAPAKFTVASGVVSQEFTITYAPSADSRTAEAEFEFAVGDTKASTIVTYSARLTKYEATPVSTAMTWNWETLTETVELTDATSPTNKDEFVFQELEDQINFGDFDASSIILSNTTYPVRSNKFQNGTIKFIADVPGVITVDFSDTGSSGDGEKRFLQVEGKVTEYYTMRDGSSDRKVSGEIPVSPGVVSINAWGEDSQKEVAIQVYSVTFTPTTMPTAVDVAIGDAGYATFCYAKPVDFTIAGESIKVYSAKVSDDNTAVVLKEVASKQVPANTAVVLESASGAVNTQGQIISAAEEISDNALLVSDGTVKGDCTDDDGFKGKIFVLNKVGDEVGFYGLAKGKTLAKGKGYLKVESAGARMLAFSFDGEATGIDSVTREALQNGKMYNLQGQEVRQATKGIFVVNGKKVIIK